MDILDTIKNLDKRHKECCAEPASIPMAHEAEDQAMHAFIVHLHRIIVYSVTEERCALLLYDMNRRGDNLGRWHS